MTRCKHCRKDHPAKGHGWLVLEQGNGRPRDVHACCLECWSELVDEENARDVAC